MNFSTITEALVDRFVSHFDELTSNTCRYNDIDGVMSYLLENNLQYGVYIESGGGREEQMPVQTASRRDWVWSYDGVLLIRFLAEDTPDTMVVKEKAMIDKLSQVLAADFRLGGTTPRAYFTEIGQPIAVKIDVDVFDFIPFNIEARDKA